MKELLAKKHAKIQKKKSAELTSGRDEKPSSDFECQKTTKHQVDISNLVSLLFKYLFAGLSNLFKKLTSRKTNNDHLQVIKHDRHQPRKYSSANSAAARSRGWHPSLNSISESSS